MEQADLVKDIPSRSRGIALGDLFTVPSNSSHSVILSSNFCLPLGVRDCPGRQDFRCPPALTFSHQLLLGPSYHQPPHALCTEPRGELWVCTPEKLVLQCQSPPWNKLVMHRPVLWHWILPWITGIIFLTLPLHYSPSFIH